PRPSHIAGGRRSSHDAQPRSGRRTGRRGRRGAGARAGRARRAGRGAGRVRAPPGVAGQWPRGAVAKDGRAGPVARRPRLPPALRDVAAGPGRRRDETHIGGDEFSAAVTRRRVRPSLEGMPSRLALLALLAFGCASAPPAPPPDQVCLGVLRARGVAFSEGPELKGVRTPVTIDGERFSPRLTPRGSRPAQMDCQLAVALVEAAPIFRNLGITQLDYSAAYDYRNRRHSDQLSQHAAGLAIDVHA